MASAVKKVVVFGATGMTGLEVLPQAVKAGYTVTAFVRNAALLPAGLALEVVTGDVLNPEDVSRAVAGQDAVIIVLGTRNELGATTMMSEGTRNIVAAMKQHGVRRVVGCMSTFLLWERPRVPARMLPVTEDHDRMFSVLRESALDWIAVMPPHIDSNLPLTSEYTVTVGATGGRVISKHDLAHFFVRCLSSDEYVGKAVSLSHTYAPA